MPVAVCADIETIRNIARIEARCRAGHQALLTSETSDHELPALVEVGGALLEAAGRPRQGRIGRVYGFGVFEAGTKAALDAILSAAVAEQVTEIRFRVAQIEQREEITAWLLARGMRRSTMVVHWCALTTPLRSVEGAYAIRPMAPSDAAEFGRLIALHYHLKEPGCAELYARLEEISGMTCVLVFDGGTVVGTGATYRDGAGCIVEYGTTLAAYRKQGIQCATIGYRLNAATRAGCEWACASTMGKDRSSHNLVRQGFAHAYDEHVYNLAAEM